MYTQFTFILKEEKVLGFCAKNFETTNIFNPFEYQKQSLIFGLSETLSVKRSFSKFFKVNFAVVYEFDSKILLKAVFMQDL